MGPPTGPPTGPPSGGSIPPYYGGPSGDHGASPSPGRKPWVLPVVIGAVIGSLIGGAVWVGMSSGDDDEEAGTGNGGTETTVDEPAETTSSVPDPESEPGATPDGISLTGTWEGTYECSQGVTGMTLTIVDVDGALDAIWEFYEVDENPGVPSGAYTMTGSVTDGTMSLAGEEWIEEPEGYVMGTLEAQLGSDTDIQRMEGTIPDSSCGGFSVDRTTTAPWYVGQWKGGYDCGQGLTGVTLTILDNGDDTVEATFAFYEVPENPGVPSGSYKMEGSYADGGLRMEGVEWIDQPDGYIMVGVESDPELTTRPSHFAGRVTDPSCTAFLLERG